jgi:hypothetical protein
MASDKSNKFPGAFVFPSHGETTTVTPMVTPIVRSMPVEYPKLMEDGIWILEFESISLLNTTKVNTKKFGK